MDSSINTATLAEARAIIAAAEAEEIARQVAKLTDQLTDIRSELRRRRRRLSELAPRLGEHSRAANEARQLVMLATRKVGVSEQARPAAADWLAGDQEVINWQVEHTKLVAELDRLSADLQRLALPHPDEAEALRLNGMGPDSVQHAEWVEQNILAQLDRLKPQPAGRSSKAWAHNSGISGVLG